MIGYLPPNMITNDNLFEKYSQVYDQKTLRKGLRINEDYVTISESIWNFFYRNYGGGPCLYNSRDSENILISKDIYKALILKIDKDNPLEKMTPKPKSNEFLTEIFSKEKLSNIKKNNSNQNININNIDINPFSLFNPEEKEKPKNNNIINNNNIQYNNHFNNLKEKNKPKKIHTNENLIFINPIKEEEKKIESIKLNDLDILNIKKKPLQKINIIENDDFLNDKDRIIIENSNRAYIMPNSLCSSNDYRDLIEKVNNRNSNIFDNNINSFRNSELDEAVSSRYDGTLIVTNYSIDNSSFVDFMNSKSDTRHVRNDSGILSARGEKRNENLFNNDFYDDGLANIKINKNKEEDFLKAKIIESRKNKQIDPQKINKLFRDEK